MIYFARISSDIHVSIYVFKSIMCQNDSDMPGEDISFLVVFFYLTFEFWGGPGVEVDFYLLTVFPVVFNFHFW